MLVRRLKNIDNGRQVHGRALNGSKHENHVACLNFNLDSIGGMAWRRDLFVVAFQVGILALHLQGGFVVKQRLASSPVQSPTHPVQ